MSDKPTGVFVRLPVSEGDARRIRAAMDTPSYEPERLSAAFLSNDLNSTALYEAKDEGASEAIRLLADFLGVTEWEVGDGTEEWDGDVQLTVANVLKAAGIYEDQDGNVATLAQIAAHDAEIVRLREALASRKRENFNAGYLIACCNIFNMHNEEGIAADILREAGISETEVKALDLNEYDAEALAVIRGAGNDDPILKGGAA